VSVGEAALRSTGKKESLLLQKNLPPYTSLRLSADLVGLMQVNNQRNFHAKNTAFFFDYGKVAALRRGGCFIAFC
jgi:arylsulfatase A-like enzyme